VSIDSVVGGANRPFIPKEIYVPTGIEAINGAETVTI
jgi:hypothetical protein